MFSLPATSTSTISAPAELVDRTAVLPHGTSMEGFLRRDYPNLNIITADDESKCYRMVSGGQILKELIPLPRDSQNALRIVPYMSVKPI